MREIRTLVINGLPLIFFRNKMKDLNHPVLISILVRKKLLRRLNINCNCLYCVHIDDYYTINADNMFSHCLKNGIHEIQRAFLVST